MTNHVLRIASINLLRDQSASRPRGDLTKINQAWKPHLVGCQEGMDYRGDLDGIGDLRVALPKGARGAATNNPILYDSTVMRLLGCENRMVHRGNAGLFPPRYETRGVFQWKVNGTVIDLFNTHVNSHIEKAGRPRNLPRTPLSSRHLREIASRMAAAAEGKSLAFLTGDMNVDEDADNRVDWSGFPNEIFREHGVQSIYDELRTPASFDTKGNRKIDVIASHKSDGQVKASKVERFDTGRLHTDHSAVCGSFTVQTR